MVAARSPAVTDDPRLGEVLATLVPELAGEPVVFVSDDSLAGDEAAIATVREPEGLSVVLTKAEADRRGDRYDFVGAWITLTTTTALDLVGLTAAVASALGDAGIGCNVIAGRFHDHLVVPAAAADRAMAALRRLASEAASR